jgi:hypothetical protein
LNCAGHELDYEKSILAIRSRGSGRRAGVGPAFIGSLYFFKEPVEGPLLSGLFLLASVAALVAVWGLYRNPPGK